MDPRAKRAADTAKALAEGAERARIAGDTVACAEILVVALQYVQLAKSFQRMADASAALERTG